MRIEDYESICNVADPADIAAALSERYGAGCNAFWLSHGDKENPALSILVNGELAYLLYFPKEGHPGLASVGNLHGLTPEGFSEFFPDQSNDSFDIMNEAVVPFSDALKAAQEFSISGTLPKCMEWDSLADGE
jgi:Immunity protein Imm1